MKKMFTTVATKKLLLTLTMALLTLAVMTQVSPAYAQLITVPAAIMTGDDEVPAVATDGLAVAAFLPNDTGTEITWAILAIGVNNITAAHIHVGAAGSNGPIIFTLATSGDAFVGGLAFGSLTAENLMPRPDMGIRTFADALAAMSADAHNLYTNIHTQAHPDGEVRGQIMPTTVELPPLNEE